jgi:hypothetical protein
MTAFITISHSAVTLAHTAREGHSQRLRSSFNSQLAELHTKRSTGARPGIALFIMECLTTYVDCYVMFLLAITESGIRSIYCNQWHR